MRLCLMIEGQEDVSWDEWLALAEATRADRPRRPCFAPTTTCPATAGSGRGSLDAWTTLAAIAAHTSRIRLGTMVSPVTFRHPSVLGNSATTVDHISGGRVELGLGAGWYEAGARGLRVSVPAAEGPRMQMLEEQLEIVTRSVDEDEFSFAGDHYTAGSVPGAAAAAPEPHPPVIVGGAGKPRSVAIAVRFAQEYNAVTGDVEECRALRERLDRACEAAGRDPATLAMSVMTTAVVGADVHMNSAAGWTTWPPWASATAAPPFARNRDDWIGGTVPEVVEKLHALAEVGVERVMLQHLCHTDIEMVELIGNELVPEVVAA